MSRTFTGLPSGYFDLSAPAKQGPAALRHYIIANIGKAVTARENTSPGSPEGVGC